jgi:chemotaxis protein methyltransferase CheR
MDNATYEQLTAIIYRESGIVFPIEKKALLVSRLRRRLTALRLSTEEEYLAALQLDRTGEEMTRLVDVVSTNVTHFYRESEQFQDLRSIIQNYRKSGKREIKIWCAAASSGEEPYTIAFEVLDEIDPANHSVRILASDICTKVLSQAVEGSYEEHLVAKVPEEIRDRHMEMSEHNGQRLWRVRPHIRRHITFKRLNLVKFPYPLRGSIDIIYCRNVMIYFDVPTRKRVVAELERLLAPGGFLFLSQTENLLGIDHKLDRAGVSIYRKPSHGGNL